MPFALVNSQENSVHQIASSEDDTFPVAPPMTWVECGAEVSAIDYKYVDGSFVYDPPANKPAQPTGADTPIEEI